MVVTSLMKKMRILEKEREQFFQGSEAPSKIRVNNYHSVPRFRKKSECKRCVREKWNVHIEEYNQ